MSSRGKKTLLFKAMIGYGAVTLFSGLVTFFYYMFDHGLRDNHMTFLFVPGLAMLALLFLIAMLKLTIEPNAFLVANFAFALLWVYQLLMGIYTMAKTSSPWLWVFLLLSCLAWAAALVLEILALIKAKRASGSRNG